MFGIDDVAAAGLVGAGASFVGGLLTNQANKDIAASNNEWSAAQYASRYQTQVKDLQAAGLNPMLAYSQSPGTAPSAQAVQFQNPVAGAQEAFHKAAERASLASTRSVQAEQIKNIEADTALKAAQAEAAAAQARTSNAQASETALRMVTGNDLTRAQTQSTFSQIAINKATLPKIAQEIVTGGANASFYRAAAAKAVAEGDITRADLTRALNEQAYESKMGPTRSAIRDIGSVAGAMHSAAQADYARSRTRGRLAR